ncbi:MAG TPA: hypothetical protein VNJ08_07320 [Bacteriovoracaceae bacterium]|nr:hypothetical protein [Bacteriovoracaceae bacterium]
MKFCLFIILMLTATLAIAQSNCDVRVGESVGMRVIEFATGNVIHSKMSLKETTADAMLEEMINLQDMEVCAEKIISKKCVLRFEKKAKVNHITLFRGEERWISWLVGAKTEAQTFVKNLKRVGFCS